MLYVTLHLTLTKRQDTGYVLRNMRRFREIDIHVESCKCPTKLQALLKLYHFKLKGLPSMFYVKRRKE